MEVVVIVEQEFQLANWLIKPAESSITDGDQVIRIKPKALSVLVVLAKANGKVVSRDELLDKVWPDHYVGDDVINSSIATLRKALGDNRKTMCFIETLPKKGYKLVQPVVWQSAGLTHPTKNKRHNEALQDCDPSQLASDSTLRVTPEKRIGVVAVGLVTLLLVGYFSYNLFFNDTKQLAARTVAVLPIDNYTNEESVEQLSKGLTEELTHVLANYPGIEIVSRTESQHYSKSELSLEKITESLQAKYLIEGSVRHKGKQIRLTLQLIDGDTGLHVFSRVVDASPNEFDEQADVIIESISRMVLAEMPFGLGGEAGWSNPVALAESCDSYLELMELYSVGTFAHVETILSPAEKACVGYAQVSLENIDAQVKIAELYLFAAEATVYDSDQMRSYLSLADQYLRKVETRAVNTEPVFVVRAGVNMLELDESLRTNKKEKDSFEKNLAYLSNGLKYYPQNLDLHNLNGLTWRKFAVYKTRHGSSPMDALGQALKSLNVIRDIEPNGSVINNIARIKKTQASFLVRQGLEPEPYFKESITLYQQAVRLRPSNSYVASNLANVLSSYAKWLAKKGASYEPLFEQSEKAYRKAISLSKTPFKVYNNLADMYSGIAEIKINRGQNATQEINNGIVNAQEALRIKPGYLWPHFNLMQLYWLKSRIDFSLGRNSASASIACQKSAENGLAIKPSIASALNRIAACGHMTVKIYIENDQLAAAKIVLEKQARNIDKAFAINPNSSLSHLSQGVNLYLTSRVNSQADYRQAIQALQKSLSINSARISAKLYLLEVLLSQFKADPTQANQLAVSQALSKYSGEPHAEGNFQIIRIIFQSLIDGKLLTAQEEISRLSQQSSLASQAAARRFAWLTIP